MKPSDLYELRGWLVMILAAVIGDGLAGYGWLAVAIYFFGRSIQLTLRDQ